MMGQQGLPIRQRQFRLKQWLAAMIAPVLKAQLPPLPADARRARWAANRWKALYGNSKYQPHQGERECARRRRQLASGFIRA